MTTAEADWQAEFEAWLAPFLARLRRQEQRRWAPVYLQEQRRVQCTAAAAKPEGRAKYSRVSWMTTGLSRISESRFGNAMSAFSVSATSQTKFSWATAPTSTTAVQIQR